VYRHASPAFAAADWSWVGAIVEAMVDDPGWFARLEPEHQAEYRRRLHAEGRLKVEPWIEDRLPADRVRVHPETRLTGCEPSPDGSLATELSSGERLAVDRVVLATGYQPRIDDTGPLRDGNLPLQPVPRIHRRDADVRRCHHPCGARRASVPSPAAGG